MLSLFGLSSRKRLKTSPLALPCPVDILLTQQVQSQGLLAHVSPRGPGCEKPQFKQAPPSLTAPDNPAQESSSSQRQKDGWAKGASPTDSLSDRKPGQNSCPRAQTCLYCRRQPILRHPLRSSNRSFPGLPHSL